MSHTIKINGTAYESTLIIKLEKDHLFRNYYLLRDPHGQFLYLKESNEPGEDPGNFLILRSWDDVNKDMKHIEISELIEKRKYWWESESAWSYYDPVFIHENYLAKVSHKLTLSEKILNQVQHDDQTEKMQLREKNYMEKCA